MLYVLPLFIRIHRPLRDNATVRRPNITRRMTPSLLSLQNKHLPQTPFARTLLYDLLMWGTASSPGVESFEDNTNCASTTAEPSPVVVEASRIVCEAVCVVMGKYPVAVPADEALWELLSSSRGVHGPGLARAWSLGDMGRYASFVVMPFLQCNVFDRA